MSRPPSAAVVSMREISKRFPGGVLANDHVSCEARAGEIHAILGENGAGKTTLMKILAGFYRPDSGEILLNGTPQVFRSPRDAKRAGIGMVHQHFSLIPALTVAENLALSNGQGRFFFRPRAWTEHLLGEAARFGLEIRPEALISELSMGEKQRVEVFRLLLQGARVLILDEPTSILAPHEAEKLFNHLLLFKSMGQSIFLVTHKIEHVITFADRVTVMRRGGVVATLDAGETSKHELAELMVGRQLDQPEPGTNASRSGGKQRVVLEIEHLTVKPTMSPYGLSDVSLSVRSGEILGVAGVGGNGQDELAAAVSGFVPFDGRISISSGQRHAGTLEDVGYVPGDRMGIGVAGTLSLADNLSLKCFRHPELHNGPWLHKEKLLKKVQDMIEEFGIVPQDPSAPVDTLSGGNIQKVLLAREFDVNPAVLVAVTPTAGLDVATVEFVHSKLRELAEKGSGILLISEDLDELLLLCDRIVVFFEGRPGGTFDRSNMDRRMIGLLMSGVQSEGEGGSRDADVA